MATARANFNSVISADATQFHATMRRVATTAKTVGSRIGKSMANATRAMGRVAASAGKAAAAVGAVGAAITAGMLKSAVSMSAEFEQIQVSMAGFLQDARKADEILAEIAEFSAVTPFETTGLQEATNLLLGAGIAADEVVDVMKELAAVSKNTEQVGELSDALAKGFAKGKFQTEELNKFLERGINLMPQLATVTGQTGAALQKAIQKGLKFEDVRTAIAAMSAEGGLFFGMLEKQSETFNGKISTLKSNWDELRVNIGKPIADALMPWIDKGISKIQSLNEIDFSALSESFSQSFNIKNISIALAAGMELAVQSFGNAMIKTLTGVATVFSKLMSKEGREIMKDLTVSQFMPTYEQFSKMQKGESIVGDRLAKLISETITDVQSNTSKTGYDTSDSQKRFFEALKTLVKPLERAGKTQSDLYEKERQAQKARIRADEAAMNFFGVPYQREDKEYHHSASLVKPDAAATARFNAQQAMHAAAMQTSTAATAGFRGLAGLGGMQVARLSGIGPGQNNAFSRDRERLGIGSGLVTGGLGAKRAVGGQKDEAATKRQIELAKSTDEHLMDIKEKVGKALTVSQ